MRRSLLFMPGNNPAMLQNSDIFDADAVIYDLEDAFSITEKDSARTLVSQFLLSYNKPFPMEVVIRKTTHAKIINTVDEENRYKELNGYPYKEYVALSSLTTGNYVEIGEIHFNAKSNNIYQVEIEEIIALLKNGVII